MCLSVLSTRRVVLQSGFWLSLRTKRDRNKRQERKKWEGERENIFATACLLAFDSRRLLVERRKQRREKQQAEKGP